MSNAYELADMQESYETELYDLRTRLNAAAEEITGVRDLCDLLKEQRDELTSRLNAAIEASSIAEAGRLRYGAALKVLMGRCAEIESCLMLQGYDETGDVELFVDRALNLSIPDPVQP